MIFRIAANTIHYTCYGHGPELLCCLPGYGESGRAFEQLANVLENRYTVICPDLPLHGKSEWLDSKFTMEQLHVMLAGMAMQEGFDGQKFSLAGFSMGGRLAMAYAEKYPGVLDKLILVAPDGLHQSFWYWLSTQTAMGNRFFKYTMQDPRWLFRSMLAARKLGMLNESIYKFTHRFLDDSVERTDLFRRWTLFRKFRPDLNRLRSTIKQQPIPTLLVFGKYDRIIQPAFARNLAGPSISSIRIVSVDTGHRLLIPPFASTIAEAILSMPAK